MSEKERRLSSKKNETAKKGQPKTITNQAIERARRSTQAVQQSGKDAWSLFKASEKIAGLHRKSMNANDANKLAANLHCYLEKEWPTILQKCGTKSALCELAFGGAASTKELYRLTLPPGGDSVKRSIRRNAHRFVQLIEALSMVLEISVGVLAWKLLRGTSFQQLIPSSGDRWDDIAKIQQTLQAIVDKVDHDFGLYQLYERTAQLKCTELEHGGQDAWPLWGLDYYDLATGDEEELQQYRQARQIAKDPSQAYYRRNEVFGHRRDEESQPSWWIYGFETGALQDCSFFYVPHTPLGYASIWNLPDRAKDPVGYDIAVEREVASFRVRGNNGQESVYCQPVDGWDEQTKSPKGQTGSSLETGPLQYYMWLLIYPHPQGGRLVPTLYQAGEDGGAYLLPIGIETLDMLHDVVWVSETEQMPLYQRIEQQVLAIGEDGMNPLERGLRRTASWLEHNPVLKRARLAEDNAKRLDQIYRATMKSGL